MADNSPNTTMEDFTNSTIDTDDLSLLELQQEVHNLEAENEANSFGSDFSINQDGNQDPFQSDIEAIPRNLNDIHDMGGKRKRKRKTRRKTKRKSLKKRRKTKKRNKKNRSTKKRK
jgi:hypothetical protein